MAYLGYAEHVESLIRFGPAMANIADIGPSRPRTPQYAFKVGPVGSSLTRFKRCVPPTPGMGVLRREDRSTPRPGFGPTSQKGPASDRMGIFDRHVCDVRGRLGASLSIFAIFGDRPGLGCTWARGEHGEHGQAHAQAPPHTAARLQTSATRRGGSFSRVWTTPGSEEI